MVYLMFSDFAGVSRKISSESDPQPSTSEIEDNEDDDDAQWARSTKNPDVSTGPFGCPLARTAHSFACSALLALLARSAALTRSLARSLCSLPRSWESE